jgi:diguanylate cyclase (GGDEF)-like protein
MDRDDALRPRFWFTPDRSLTDSGFGGELIVARTRLFFAVAVLFVPVVGVASQNRTAVDVIGLIGTSLLVVIAALVWMVVQRGWVRAWLPFATSLFDVSLISAISVGYIIAQRGDVAVNSRVTYPAYFLALAATCLRYDVRICIVTGAAAIVQYAAIVFVGMHRFPASPALIASYYGRLDWGDQIGRVILLTVATALTATIVDRGRRLRLMSTHDALTGLYNRGYFDERLSEELLRARRYHRPLSIALLDLDHFKSVNDKYGHAAGDAALRRFSDLLYESFRRTDIVARYGGEEFAVALPETDAPEALLKLEQLRQLVETTPLLNGDVAGELHLTFSAGVVHYPGDGDATTELVHLADAHLLRAKREGRNRVTGSRRAVTAEEA